MSLKVCSSLASTVVLEEHHLLHSTYLYCLVVQIETVTLSCSEGMNKHQYPYSNPNMDMIRNPSYQLKKCAKALLLTRLASSLNGRHSPKAFKRVVMFFFGSGLDNAKIIGLCGFARKRITCKDSSITPTM